MFKRLKHAWKERNIDINEFWASSGPLKANLQQLLEDEFHDINTNRRKDFLIKRIRKIGRNVNFSVRERFLLKRLLKEQKHKQQIKYSKLEYYLPGKTVAIIKEEINSISNI